MSLYFSDLYVMIDFYVTESESCPVSQVYSLQPRAWTAKDFSTPPQPSLLSQHIPQFLFCSYPYSQCCYNYLSNVS